MARVKLKSTTVGTLYCDWSSTQNVSKNQSTITLSLVFVTASGYTIGPWTDYNGSYIGTTSLTFDGSIPNFQGTRTIATKKMTVTHDSDGTKTQTIRWKWGVNSSWGGYVNPSGSFSITLPTIARASVPTLSAKSVTMGNNVTIYTNRASSSFTHTIKFKFGAYSATIATDVGTSFTYPTQLAMASYVPNATSGSGTFTVYTYNGSTLIGSKTVNITLNVPSSIVPSISGAATTEANSEVTIGLFVQNISKINVAITASGSYESTISEYTSTFEGKTYKGQTFTIESLNVSGDRELSVNVKDSRGRTATYTRTITINEYTNPNISAFSAYRCNSSGIQDDSGSYVKFTYSFNITSLSSKNKHVVKIQYKLNDAADWTDLTSNANYSGANVVYKSGAIFDPNHTYNVRLYVEDSFNSSSMQLDINTETTTIDFLAGGKGISFGKVAENSEEVDIAWNLRVRADALLKTVLATDWYKSSGNTGWMNETYGGGIYMIDSTYVRVYNGKGFMVDGTSHLQSDLNTIGVHRFTSQWLGFYANSANAQSNADRIGWIGSNGSTNLYLTCTSGGTLYIQSAAGGIDINNTDAEANIELNSARSVTFKSSSRMIYFECHSGATYPAFRVQGADSGDVYLGISTARWKTVYSVNSLNASSDRNLKKNIEKLDERYEKLFMDLVPVRYMFKAEGSDRYHTGFIAQDVQAAMQKYNISDLEFAAFCKDRKTESVINEKGEEVLKEKVLKEGEDPYEYSLRYGEIVSLNTHMIQKCLKKIDDLQKIIEQQNKRIEVLEKVMIDKESE